MRFSFSQSVISRGLQKVMGAVSSKVPIPSLSNVHLRIEDHKLHITATDLEVTVTASVELVESDGTGAVLVQAKRLQELINALPDMVLEMEVTDNFKVSLKGEGLGHYQIPGGNPLDFPELPTVDAGLNLKMSGTTLKRMVGKTIFAVSKDDMRPVLTGLLLQVKGSEVRMVATDGHRLSKISRFDANITGEPRDEVIPMKALNLLTRSLDDDDEVSIGLAQTRAVFHTDGQRLITRLIDGNYPKYEQVIPTSQPSQLRIRTGEWMSAVRRTSIFASSISHQVKLDIKAGELKIEASDPEYGGHAEEHVPCNFVGEDLEIAYNSQYLSDCLRQIDTEDTEVGLSNSNDAAIIKPTHQATDEEFLMLLMPIRLR
ncbi:MAG: DNA polymerase III subunit beta [Calditrichaeota bacterium]|nr:DNA polymerase III subunit beta [Calditrichota bacterium]